MSNAKNTSIGGLTIKESETDYSLRTGRAFIYKEEVSSILAKEVT